LSIVIHGVDVGSSKVVYSTFQYQQR